MKKLEPVLEKIRKYGEGFLQFFEELEMEKDGLMEINEKIRSFLTLKQEGYEKISSEEEQKKIALTLLIKYIQHLIVHGRVEDTRVCLSLVFFRNLHTLEIVNCGIVHEVRNAGRINTILCENSTVPLKDFTGDLHKIHYTRTPVSRIDISKIPKTKIIDFAFKNSFVEDVSVFFPEPWKNVEVWSFRGNKIKEIRTLAPHLPNVVVLDLSFNSLSDISFLNELTKLECLDISMNNISNPGSSVFRGRNLSELNISHNMLTSTDCLLNLANLHKLDISFNQISSFDEIYKLTKLTKLNQLIVKGNRICKENEETYPKIIRQYFEFQQTFSLDGVKDTTVVQKDEYDNLMTEIQRREAAEQESRSSKSKKKRSGRLI